MGTGDRDEPATEPRPNGPFRLGDWIVDPPLNRLRNGDEEVAVEPRVMRTLLRLAREPCRPVPHEALIEDVWRGTHVTASSLTLAISDLRRALGDDPRRPRYIETIQRVGYRLLVEPRDGPTGPAADPPPLEEGGPVSASPPRRARVRTIALVVSAVLVGLVVGLHLARGRRDDDSGSESRGDAPWSAPRPATSHADLELEPSVRSDGALAFLLWQGPGSTPRIHVREPGSHVSRPLTSDPGWEQSPRWSPDGDRLAFLRCPGGDCVLTTVRSDGSDLVDHISVRGIGPRRIAWSPDGERLVFVDAGPDGSDLALFELEASTGSTRLLVPPRPGQTDAHPAVAPDGEHLAWVRGTGRSKVDSGLGGVFGRVQLRRADGAVRAVREEADVLGVAFSPDSRALYLAVFDSASAYRIVLLDLATGSEQLVTDSPTPLRHPEPVPGTEAVLYETWAGDQDVWSLDPTRPGHEPEPFLASSWSDQWPAIGPRSRRVAFLSSRSGQYEVWVRELDDGHQWPVTRLALGQIPLHPRWSNDGGRLAFAVESGRQATLAVTRAEQPPPPPIRPLELEGRIEVSGWSLDGRRILFSTLEKGDWNLWQLDPEEGGPRTLLQPGASAGFEWGRAESRLFFQRGDEPGIWERLRDGRTVRRIEPSWPQPNHCWGPIDDGLFSLELASRGLDLALYDPEDFSRRVLATLPPGLTRGRSLAFSRDGRLLLFEHLGDLEVDIMRVERVDPGR